jgi:hypothetical protein
MNIERPRNIRRSQRDPAGKSSGTNTRGIDTTVYRYDVLDQPISQDDVHLDNVARLGHRLQTHRCAVGWRRPW